MPSFHEFDIALSPNTPAPGASLRTSTNEAHINIWLAGTKGSPVATLSDPSNAAAAVGIVLSASRSGVPLVNAPSELVLGDSAGAWLLNIADLNVNPGAGATTLFSGVYLF